MFNQFFKRFAQKETISVARYAKDHATMTNKQLDMIKANMDKQLEMIGDHMNTMKWQLVLSNQMVLAGFAGVGYMFHLEKENTDKRFEQVDKRFEHVESELKEIKALVIQSMNKK